jgi:hypothetical protein
MTTKKEEQPRLKRRDTERLQTSSEVAMQPQ